MSLSEKVKKLSQLNGGGYPILSLYLPYTHRSMEELDKQRIFFKNLEKTIEEKGHTFLRNDIKKIQQFLDARLKPQTHGVAFFSCSVKDIFEVVELWVPMHQQYTIEERPSLRQLIRIMDDYEDTMVIGISSEIGRILRITAEAVAEDILKTEDFPGRHDQGGWSQARFQRHIEEHLHRHMKKVAEKATKAWDQNHFGFLILWGQEHITQEFSNLLPKRMMDRYAGTLSADVRTEEKEITNLAIHLLREVEEKEALEEIDKMKSQQKVVYSWEDILSYLSQGRIHKLYVKAFSSIEGWLCSSCELMGNDGKQLCPQCSQPVESVDLVETSMMKVEQQGGKVEVSTQIPFPVAGILRY